MHGSWWWKRRPDRLEGRENGRGKPRREAPNFLGQTFLSTAGRLSEVLSIVRDLDKNIYQVAVSLTEGWTKMGVIVGHWSNRSRSYFSTPRPSPRPTSPQPGLREFDFQTSAVSLLGRKHSLELASLPGVGRTQVRLPGLIHAR